MILADDRLATYHQHAVGFNRGKGWQLVLFGGNGILRRLFFFGNMSTTLTGEMEKEEEEK